MDIQKEIKKLSKRKPVVAILLAIFVVILSSLGLYTQDNFEIEEVYTVTEVVDGDTIKIKSNTGQKHTVRFIGIDTPETKHPTKGVECFGIEASEETTNLLLDQEVEIEFDPSQQETDRYGRLLLYVWRKQDGLFINRYLVENGYAYEYTYQTPYEYQSEFMQLQETASTKGLGLWGRMCQLTQTDNQ